MQFANFEFANNSSVNELAADVFSSLPSDSDCLDLNTATACCWLVVQLAPFAALCLVRTNINISFCLAYDAGA